MERHNQQMRLKDGRRLGFAEYGATRGVPVIYFHGWPSSRLEAAALDELCQEMGVCLVAPDRPGFGLSDFQPGRSIPDFSHDIGELAANLGWERFSLLGVSGGGPYAVACAARIPERLSVTLLVCSVGPCDAPDATKGMVAINRWLLSTARRFPRVAQGVGSVCLWAVWGKGGQAIPKRIERQLPLADRQALASPQLRQALTASSVEALRNGVRAAAADGLLYGKPWGFDLRDIHTPVFLWHGEADIVVPATMGHYLASNIPNCQASFSSTDGHFSLPFTRMREILQRVIE